MPNKKSDKPPGNIYDKIFRENAEHLFIPLIAKLFKLKIASYKPLQVKFPKTSEGEVDFLYEIVDANQNKQILHVEFQSDNDPNMLERMQEYHSKIYKKFKLPISPLVINLSRKAFTARTQLKPEEIFKGYEVINLFELPTNEMLSSQVPEVVVLALLSNYPKNEIEGVLRLIIKQLKKMATTEKDLRRYVTQLLFLSRLRNFEVETEKIIDNMPITYDIETDGLYIKGKAEGLEKGLEKGIIVCYEMGLQAEEIAQKFELELEQVLKVIKAYKRKK